MNLHADIKNSVDGFQVYKRFKKACSVFSLPDRTTISGHQEWSGTRPESVLEFHFGKFIGSDRFLPYVFDLGYYMLKVDNENENIHEQE
jgi:hypothetical protein